MQRRDYLMNLSRLLLISLLAITVSACASRPEKEIVVQTKLIERNIPTQPRPRGLQLHDITWYAVTPENFEEFKERFENENGNQVFFAISVPDYENLSLNMADIKRYIEQQQAIIVYYENAVKPTITETEEKE